MDRAPTLRRVMSSRRPTRKRDEAADSSPLIEPPGFLMLNYGRRTISQELDAALPLGVLLGYGRPDDGRRPATVGVSSFDCWTPPIQRIPRSWDRRQARRDGNLNASTRGYRS
jgi:hypothetical protein